MEHSVEELSDLLWKQIDENTRLSQENYMLKSQIEEIKKLLKSE